MGAKDKSPKDVNGRQDVNGRPDVYDPWNRARNHTLHIPEPDDTGEPSPFAQRVALSQATQPSGRRFN